MPVDHTREIAMEMHQVRYFLAVADELNFTRASEQCNVTQPSLSRAIKLLEEELGGPLFRRERAAGDLSGTLAIADRAERLCGSRRKNRAAPAAHWDDRGNAGPCSSCPG